MKKNNSFALKIKMAIKDADITQVKLQKLSGFSQSHISRWINGAMKPDLESLRALAKALNKPLSYFINDDIKEQPNEIELLKKELENQNLRIKLLEKEIELLKK